jgi:murein tripeptide amidase MpaA
MKKTFIILSLLIILAFFSNTSVYLQEKDKKQYIVKHNAQQFYFSPANFADKVVKSRISLPLNILNEKQQSKVNNETYFIVKIELIDEEIKYQLLKLNLDIMAVKNNAAYVLARPEDLELMSTFGLDYFLIRQVQPQKQKAGMVSSSSANGAFHSYSEVEEGLRAMAQEYSPIASLHDLGETLEGRTIWGLKISDNVELEENEVKVLFIGCHHAREWISVEVPYMLAEYLLREYRENSQVRRLVNQSEIWIVPLLNPDGLEYSIHTFRWWRKNRRDNNDGTFGVDPNRNYSYMWGFDDEGSSPQTWAQSYRGPYAFSEPETEAMRQLLQQREYKAAISYHNYSQLVLYPWSYCYVRAPHYNILDYLATRMSQLMEASRGYYYDPGQGSGLYTTNGDFADWAYGIHGSLAFTIELSPDDILLGGFVNAQEEIIPIFQENLPAALFLIQWCIDNF